MKTLRPSYSLIPAAAFAFGSCSSFAAPAATAAAPTLITSCDATTIQNALSRGGDYSLRCSGNIGPRLVSGVAISFSVSTGKTVRLVNDSGAPVRLFGAACVRTLRVKGTLSLDGIDIRNGSFCGSNGAFGSNGAPGAIGVDGANGGDHVTKDGSPGTPGGSGGIGGNGATGGSACGGGLYIDPTGIVSLRRVAFESNRATGGNGGAGGSGGVGGRGGRGGQGSYTYTVLEGAPGNGGAGASGGNGGAGGKGGRGGTARGGGICNYGSLDIVDSRFFDNQAIAGTGLLGGGGGSGGAAGIGGSGEFNTASQSCAANAPAIRGGNGGVGARGGDGAVAGTAGVGGEARGAAIYSEGSLSVSNTVFSYNVATGGIGAQGQSSGNGAQGGDGGSGERGRPNGVGGAGGNGGSGAKRSSGAAGGAAFGAAISTQNGGGAQLFGLSFSNDRVVAGNGGIAGHQAGTGGRAGTGGYSAAMCTTAQPSGANGVAGTAGSTTAGKPGATGLTGAPELDLR